MRVAAFGRTHWLLDSIKAIASRSHEIVLIGTCQSAPEYSVTDQDFAELAIELGCPYFCDSAINRPQYIEMVKESKAEVAISINWLTMIGTRMLGAFKYGVINAHAGDLPRFRGNAAPNWAILSGEPKVVLTLHQMTEELDAGPVLMKRGFDLTGRTYISEVYRFLDQNIPEMFVKVLEGLTEGTIVPIPQPNNPGLSLRCFPRLPQDGRIDWNWPAVQIARLVRASAEPFAGAYSYLGNEKVIVWRAHPEKLHYPYLGIPGQVTEIRQSSGEVAVLTGEGVLFLEEIETATWGRIKAADAIRSTRIRLGMDEVQTIAELTHRVAQLETRLNELLSEQSGG